MREKILVLYGGLSRERDIPKKAQGGFLRLKEERICEVLI